MRAAVLAAFFLSGASSLVFESLWVRELVLVFGSTTLAVATVLATFMGGLGLGSYLASRHADRLLRPLRAYALIEAAIGIYALFVPLALSAYPALARLLYQLVGGSFMALSLGRFVASWLLLGLPTTLMGATLPLLARHILAAPSDMNRVGLRLGTLYAVNTMGALAGTFAAGFLLLPLFGIRATNWTAAGTNLLLAAAVLAYERRTLAHPPLPPSVLDAAPPREPVPARVGRLVLWAFGISGATAMTLEVLWTRALAVVIGSSVYSFTLILVAFLTGLAGGARISATLAERVRRPVAALGWVHLLTAALVGSTYLLIDKLPRLFVVLLRQAGFGVDTIQAVQFLLAVLVIVPPTVAMGAVFPLTMRIYAGGAAEVGRDVGRAYAVNTVGAIVGSFLAGFVVLPKLGLQHGIFAAGAIDLFLGAILIVREPLASRALRMAGLSLTAALAGIAFALPSWNLVTFGAGLFRVSIAREILEEGKWTFPELVYYRDGISTTVSVERWSKSYALKNNGKVDASNGDDMPTQIMVGLMPFFFSQKDAPRTLVIGYGSGVTVGAVTQARTGPVDVVELEPAVVEASQFFENVNHRPLSDPRLRLHAADGRNFLAQSTDRYDVIISEPSNPWITGVSNLFTREYWRMAHERLAERGVFCQWAQLYEMSPYHIKTILRTFASEFPYTYVFAAEDLSSDVILVAADEKLVLDREALSRKLADSRFRAEAARGGVKSAEDVVAYLLLAPDELPAFTAGVPINTDDNALIEFGAPRDLLGYHQYDPYLGRVYGAGWPYGHLDGVLAPTPRPEADGQLAEALLAHGKVREASHFIKRAGPHAGRSAELADLLARDPKIPEDLEPPRLPESLPPAESERLAKEYTRVERLIRMGGYKEAQALLDSWPPKVADAGGDDLALLYSFIAWKANEFADALDAIKRFDGRLDYLRRRPEALHVIGRIHYAVADYQKGVDALLRYLALRTGVEP